MRIAIIEDDEITRLELSKLLHTQGYETVLLTDFENLTEELKQYSAQLVLLDINLPYENGYPFYFKTHRIAFFFKECAISNILSRTACRDHKSFPLGSHFSC